MCEFDSYDEIVYLFYDREENTFYDQCGFNIINIFDMITPNDLLLFKIDSTRRYFTHRYNNRTLCKITEDGVYESEIDFQPCDLQTRNLCLAFNEYNEYGTISCKDCVDAKRIERKVYK